jgi:PAS domain S-box-containing protein
MGAGRVIVGPRHRHGKGFMIVEMNNFSSLMNHRLIDGLLDHSGNAVGLRILKDWRDRSDRNEPSPKDTRLVHQEPRERTEGAIGLRAAIVECCSDAIISKDMDGMILSWNSGAERLFGYTAAEAIGCPIEILIPLDRRDEEPAILERIRRGERVDHFESIRMAKDGRMICVSLMISPVSDAAGRIIGASKIARDITERKRSEEPLRRYADRLENLRALDLAILAAQSTEAIAEIALEHLSRLVPCWLGGVALQDLEGQTIQTLASIGHLAQSYPPGKRFAHNLDTNSQSEALRRGIVIVQGDIGGAIQTNPVLEKLRGKGLRSYAMIPLMNQGRLIGSILLGSDRTDAFSAEHLDVISEVADHLAIAIHQSLLLEDLRSAQARSKSLSRQLLRAQEDERRRIARELHDEVGQGLTAAKIAVDRIASMPCFSAVGPRLADASALIAGVLDQVRDLTRLLRPPVLDDFGLKEALLMLAEGITERTGLDIDLRIDPEIGRIDPEVETACYRIAQEALNNALKHAKASRLSVSLRRDGVNLELVVGDDGAGFDLEAATTRASQGLSLGLLGLSERATLAGGYAEIKSVVGVGTKVRTLVPAARRPGCLYDRKEC